MCKTVWDDSSHVGIIRNTKHCVSLSATCLTVSKYGSIVTFDNRLNEGECTLIVNLLLFRIYVVDGIIRETLSHAISVGLDKF